MGGQQSSIGMDVKRINQGVYKKRKREDDEEISIESLDSYSKRSLGLEHDEYQEDYFLEIKKENLKRKKNLNRDCCRKTLDCHEEQTKVEKIFELKLKD